MKVFAQIYYNDRSIFVSAVHRDVKGITPNGRPAFLWSREAELSGVAESLLVALQGSRDQLSVSASQQEMTESLMISGEKSWDTLSRRWELIAVEADSSLNEVKLVPMRRYATGGHVAQTLDRIHSVAGTLSDVANVLKTIFDGPARTIVEDEPSHT